MGLRERLAEVCGPEEDGARILDRLLLGCLLAVACAAVVLYLLARPATPAGGRTAVAAGQELRKAGGRGDGVRPASLTLAEPGREASETDRGAVRRTDDGGHGRPEGR